MSTLKERIKNNKFLVFVILSYVVLGITMPDKALLSFQNSLYYIKEMLMIMPVILLLTALIEAWVPKHTIQSALGKDAGIKGLIFSFLLGSFSAGPIYAAFPICKTLLKKGASVANLVVILSAWAVVKLPMLVNESKFLGTKFMIIRWLLTTVAIFAMAFIISKIVKKEDIPMEEIEEKEDEGRLYVEKEYCIGCGICVKSMPETFEMSNKKAIVNKTINKREENKAMIELIEKCPASAIKYKKNSYI